jgi:hypothetical protein
MTERDKYVNFVKVSYKGYEKPKCGKVIVSNLSPKSF